MKRVTSRMMRRFIYGGKSYGTAHSAWKAAAKDELQAIIFQNARRIAKDRGVEFHFDTEDIYAAYAEMFPHSSDNKCFSVRGGCRWRNVEWIDDVHIEEGAAFSWCKVAHRNWIELRFQN